jgi:hypothetical protein
MVRLVTSDERRICSGLIEPRSPARRAYRSPQGWVGWVAGTIAPGVSVLVFSPLDGERIPEVISPRGWRAVVEQIEHDTHPVRLTWQHGGLDLVGTDTGSLRFRWHSRCGLMFEARLPHHDFDEIVLGHLAKSGAPASICYRQPEQRIVEDPVLGRVRVLDRFVLDHVAILPLRSGIPPAYPAARTYGIRTGAAVCPFTPRANAIRFACVELARRWRLVTKPAT